MTLFPVSVQLPIAVGDSLASVDLPETQEIAKITGSLQALASGTLVIRVRDDAANLLGTLSWSASGNRSVEAASFPETTRLHFDVTAIGTGADGLYVSVWCNPSAREAPVIELSGLNNGLVSLWKMEEASGTRYDAVGSNHLTDNNTVTASAGKIGDAAQFVRANSEYLSIADNPMLRVGASDAHWYAWIYPDSLALTLETAGKRQGADEWVIAVLTTGAIQFNSWHGGAIKTAQTAGGLISTATWYFIDWWVDGVNSLIGVSINNGVAVTVATGGSAQDGGATLFQIGSGSTGAPTGSFDGRIDAFGWWNRLLTSDELTALYNGGNGLPYPF